MWFSLRLFIVIAIAVWALPRAAAAQDAGYFAGAVAGVATLSGDPSFVVTPDGFIVSKYKPENGTAVNVFIGAHVREYVTVQANYIWNRNDITLASGVASDTGTRFYEQPRASSQHAVIGDLLVYFRERASRIRPYLSGGFGVVRFETDSKAMSVDGVCRCHRPISAPLTSCCGLPSASISRSGTGGMCATRSARASAQIRSAASSIRPGRGDS